MNTQNQQTKNAQHTPGPWKVVELGRDMGVVPESRPVQSVAVCSRLYREDAPDADANARLIAAAPDLLNMLERMVAETTGGFAPCLLTLEHARNALAKAKGGAA